MEENPKLRPDVWIEAGVLALLQAGIDAVRVETLAKSLGVTKGSFYWHFKDRRALLDAILDWWETRTTSEVIDTVEKAGGAPAARLERLIELCTSGRADQLEGALRAWAGADTVAQAVVQRVDRRREKFVTDLFRDLGFPKDTAAKRARILYLALIGEFTWTSNGGRPSGRPIWTELYALLVAR